MDRSLFPEGVEVHQRHLENTETTKAAAIKQGHVDIHTRGVVSGLTIGVNSGDNTKFDVASGYGYAINGELIKLATTQTGVSLASNVFGTKNYVLLMYDEVQSSPEGHETDGTTRMTKATASPRLVVLTEAAYTALPTTDAVLSNNAKDRALLVGIITASGSAISLSNVQSPTNFNSVLQATQPVNVTGIQIIRVDPLTSTGSGILSINGTTKATTWQAPGEGSPGTPVTLTTSGTTTLSSSTLKTLQINVTHSLLPSTNQSDTIGITNMYAQPVSRFTAQDFQHRSMIGSGVPTSTNPHGMTLEDLAPGTGGTLEGHQDIQHANGIVRTSNPNLLKASVNTAAAPDTVSVQTFSTGDIVYINGKKIESISTSTITFSDGTPEPGTYGIYLGQDGNLFKQQIARFPAIGTSVLQDKIQILDIRGFSPGTTSLTWTNTGFLHFAAGPQVAAPSTNSIIRLYGLDRVAYIDLYVKGGGTPGATQTDTITVLSQPVDEENIPVANVPWSGSAAGFVGVGFQAGQAPNLVYDKRIFGTLAEAETRYDAGMINAAKAVTELLGDGILVRSRTQSGAAGNNEVTPLEAINDAFVISVTYPTVGFTGGSCYVGGHRFDIASGSLNLYNNTTNVLYIDADGVVQISDQPWTTVVAAQFGRPIIRLYEVVINTGALVGTPADVREYVGQKRNQPMGVWALDKYRRAILTTDSGHAGPAVDIYSNTGTGLVVRGAETSGTNDAVGLVAVAQGTGNNRGIYASGVGTYEGVVGVGGNTSGKGGYFIGGGGAGGIGVHAQAGGTDADGVYAVATGTGRGVHGVGAGTNGAGVLGSGGGTAGNGVEGNGAGGTTNASIGVRGIGGTNNSNFGGPDPNNLIAGPSNGGVFIGGAGTGGGDGIQAFGRAGVGYSRTGVWGAGSNGRSLGGSHGGAGSYFYGGFGAHGGVNQQGFNGGAGVIAVGNQGGNGGGGAYPGDVGGYGGRGGHFVGGDGGYGVNFGGPGEHGIYAKGGSGGSSGDLQGFAGAAVYAEGANSGRTTAPSTGSSGVGLYATSTVSHAINATNNSEYYACINAYAPRAACFEGECGTSTASINASKGIGIFINSGSHTGNHNAGQFMNGSSYGWAATFYAANTNKGTINIAGRAGSPGSPVNGDIWFLNALPGFWNGILYMRVNGANQIIKQW